MRRALSTTLALTAVTALGLGLGPVVAFADDDRRGNSSSKDDRDDDRDDDDDRNDELQVIGLAGAGTRFVSFSTDDPGDARRLGAVNGLTGGDTRLVGIDYRVQDRALYGVGNNAASAGVYRIDPRTGTATQVGRLNVALSGVNFGVDFNPVANALRIVSDNGQNLRQSFANQNGDAFGAGTANDGALNYPGGQPVPISGPPASGVTGVAYTNNDENGAPFSNADPVVAPNGQTATTLFDLDTSLDQIAIQSPANSGFLAATGKLGVDFAPDAGFDIYSKLRPKNSGPAVELFPYAVNNVGGNAAELFDVDLLSGRASSDGKIGDPTVTDLAIPLNQL